MGIDDPSAYYGYSTRFFQDSKGNTVQILINKNTGRIVNIWADAANESMSFTARDTSGQPAIIKWSSADARITSIGQTRFIQYTLSSEVPALDIGLFMLASMRVERDYQYFQRHLLPFGTEKYIEHELSKLIQNLERLPANIRHRHLSLLNVKNINELRSRLAPRVKLNKNGLIKSVLVEQPTFEGQGHRQAGEDVGRGPHRRFAQCLSRPERALEQASVGSDRITSDGFDDQRAYHQRREYRQEWHQNGIDGWPQPFQELRCSFWGDAPY